MLLLVLLCTSVLHHRDGSFKTHPLSCCLFLFYLLSTDTSVSAVFIVRVVAKDW